MTFRIAAILLLLIASLPAQAADGQPVRYNYALYAGGLKVVNVTLNYAQGNKTYDANAIAQTTGIWSSLVPWRNMINVHGQITPTGVKPQLARYDDVWREKARSTQYTFGKDGLVSAVANPPHKLGGRVEATDEQKRNTLDPLSAVIKVMVQGAAQGCQGKIPAFDGRRVYNLVLNNKGTEQLKETDYNLYAGPAERCEVTFEAVAGFPEKETRAGFWSARDNGEKNPLIIWLAKPAPELPVVPVRVQSTVQLGTLVAHLREVKPQEFDAAALPNP